MVGTLKLNSDVLLTEMADGTAVLLHLNTKFYYTLNATGVRVWKGLAAEASLNDLVNDLTRDFRVEAPSAQKDVHDLLSEFLDEGLILQVP